MKGLSKGVCFLNRPPADLVADPRGNKSETGNIKTQPQSLAPSFGFCDVNRATTEICAR